MSELRVHTVSWFMHSALTAARRREYFMRQARIAKSKGDARTTELAVKFARGYQHQIVHDIGRTRKAAHV